MKKILTLVFATLFAVSSQAQVAPDFTITDINNNTLNLYSSLNQGNIVIVKFFTTWCSVCNATAPQVQGLWEGYENSSQNILMWGIDRDNNETEQQVINYSNTHGITYPEAAMGGSVASQYGVTYQPDYRIICPDKSFHTTTSWNQVDAKVQACQSILSANEIENGFSVLKIFPNPANNEAFLNFSLDANTEISVSLFNQLGQEVKTYKQGVLEDGEQTVQVDLTGVSAGVYAIGLFKDGAQVATRKLVVE